MIDKADQETRLQSNEEENTMGILREQLAHVSTEPGVYIMKDAGGRILYVGKARNLKKRLHSYFQKSRPLDPKTMVMVAKIARFETILTRTEKEALILESSLIKRHRPRYNVVLKDDKRYPSLRLDTSHDFPNLTIARKVQKDGALYFGPYASAAAVRQTLKFIHRTFKLRKCSSRTFGKRTRPCLNHQMGLCLGACSKPLPPGVYDDIVKEVVAFLKGRTPELIDDVKQQMQTAAQKQEFERAAQLRDKMYALEKTLERQVTVSNDFKDRDVYAVAGEEEMLIVTLLKVRRGVLQGSRHFQFEGVVGEPEDQLGLLLRQFYDGPRPIPPEIITDHEPGDVQLVEAFLAEQRGAGVHIHVPKRGEKRRLVEMAQRNACKELEERLQAGRDHRRLLGQLQKRLRLQSYPGRIECFDNSTLQGSNTVSGRVVFLQGRPSPEEYRHYAVEDTGKPDDYAVMAQVLHRRFSKGEESKPYPDLLLLDGGRGQIGVAVAVLAELGLTGQFDVAGIAKPNEAKGERDDKIYLAGRSNPVQFGRQAELLLFLQRVRDEAHRWAIGYQRRRRHKNALRSALDQIPGVGPKRRAVLLRRFGDLRTIRDASLDKLKDVPGITQQLAEAIKAGLGQED